MWNSKFKSLAYNSSREFWNLFSCSLFCKNNTIKVKSRWVNEITPCPIKEKKEGITRWTSEKFQVAVKRIRGWRQNKLKIFEPIIKPKNKRVDGAGRKPLDQQLENRLVKWIYDRRSNELRLWRKLIMAKA